LELKKYNTSFVYNNISYFILFCLVCIIKCVWNNLIAKNSYFKYPELKDDQGTIILKAGIYDIKFIRQLYNMIINEFLNNMNFAKKVCYLSTIDWQQVSPALLLFSQ